MRTLQRRKPQLNGASMTHPKLPNGTEEQRAASKSPTPFVASGYAHKWFYHQMILSLPQFQFLYLDNISLYKIISTRPFQPWGCVGLEQKLPEMQAWARDDTWVHRVTETSQAWPLRSSTLLWYTSYFVILILQIKNLRPEEVKWPVPKWLT